MDLLKIRFAKFNVQDIVSLKLMSRSNHEEPTLIFDYLSMAIDHITSF